MAARHPSLRVLELDRDATIAIRKPALRACCIAQPRLAMRCEDFATDELRDALRDLEDTGLDRDAATVAVADSLLTYLTPAAVAPQWLEVPHHTPPRADVENGR